MAHHLLTNVVDRDPVRVEPQKHLHALSVLKVEEAAIGPVCSVVDPEPSVRHDTSVKLGDVRVVGVEDVQDHVVFLG